MSKHTDEHEDASPPRRTTILLALGVTASVVAWGVLVFAAIDFGREARSGEGAAWFFLALSTLGAAACLFVALILGARLLSILQGKEPPQRPSRAPRVPGKRRAER